MEDIKMIFAKNFISLRKLYSLTQSEIAEKLNYSDKAISKWERGESVPDIIVLKQISQMFGVTIDYLFEEEHENIIEKPALNSGREKKNRTLISLLAATLVWLIATVVYVSVGLAIDDYTSLWKIYVYALPVSFMVLIVFNGIWGKRKWTFFLVSFLTWSILLTVFVIFLQYNMWLLFFIGIPAQIILLLWANLYRP